MTPDRLRQVASVLEIALELDVETRDRYLDTLAVQDPELAGAVRAHLPAAPGDEIESGLEALSDDGTATVAEPVAPTNPLALPKRIGPYRIDGWLGAGGMGAVYSAIRDDREFERRVAIKVLQLRFPTDEMVRRFRGERQILAAFDHPNIAKLYEGAATEEGLPYLVMELVEGSPLTDFCDDRGLSITERIHLFRKVCAAVQYAHSRLVVHRDLKPTNVLVTADGEPKLLDFGIAKLLDPEAFPLTVQATMTGPGPFTPRYASPEQLRGEAITTASDVYSLGVLMYLALTGTLPYRPSKPWPSAILEHMSSHEPPPISRAVLTGDSETSIPAEQRFGAEPSVISRELQGDLDNIVAKAIEVDPERRYRSVEQLDDDLRRYLEGAPVLARQGTALYRAGKFVRRHRAGVGAALGFVGMSGSFAVAMSRQAARVARERNAALEARDRAEQAQLVAEQSSRAEQEVSRVLVELFESEDPQNRDPNVSALSLVQKGVARVQEHASLALPTRIKLLGTLGLVLRNLGEYPTSADVLKQAAGLGEGERIPEKADVFLNLGRVYESMGDFERASAALKQASALAAESGEASTMIDILNLQGIVAYYTGSSERAIRLYREAQQLSETTHGPLHPSSWMPRLNAASIDGDQGRVAEAIEEVILILEATREHPSLVRPHALPVLAGLFWRANHLEMSLRAYYSGLESNREVYGPHHKRFLRLLFMLIQVLCGFGESSRARALIDSVDIQALPDHLRASVDVELRMSRGIEDFVAGRYSEATKWFGPLGDSPSFLSPLASSQATAIAAAAWANVEKGDHDMAERFLSDLEELQAEATNEVSLLSLIFAVKGRIRESEGQLDLAEKHYREVLLESPASLGKEVVLAQSVDRLVAMLRARDLQDEADEVLSLRERNLEPQFPFACPSWLFESRPPINAEVRSHGPSSVAF